jgi:hypothetical protein
MRATVPRIELTIVRLLTYIRKTHLKDFEKARIDLPFSLTLIEIPSFPLLVLYSVAITIAAPQQNYCESAERPGILHSA